jgi:hypothetical protein
METVTQETALDSRFTEFNIRKDVSHFVRLHDHATKRFESYVRSLGSTLAGGILLGTVDLAEQWSITVKDFTPVLCEHRRDGRSSFVDCPAQCFKNAIRRANQSAKNNRTIVGYYRSHSRPDFSLEKEDHDLAKRYFAQDARFLLLIKPSPASFATGMFYLTIEGQLDPERSSVEFPISLKELGAEAPEPEELERLAAIPSAPIVIPQLDRIPVPVSAPLAPVVPVVQVAPAPTSQPAPAIPASRLSEQFWKGAAAAAILLGSVFAIRSYRAPSGPETAIVSPAPVAPASSPSPTNAEPAPNQARTTAPAVNPGPTPVESRRPDPPAPSVPEKIASAPRVEPKKFVLPAQQKATPATSVLSVPPETPPSGIALSTPTLPAPTVPAPALPVTPAPPAPVASGAPAQGNPASHPAPEPVRNPPAPAPAVATTPTASVGPVTPPHVVRQASTVVPEAVKRKLRGDVLVKVLVDVDANGKVVNAISVTPTTKITQPLVGLAIEAARQSQFEPAKQGDKKLAGQTTLQFRFEGEVIRLPVQPSIR